MTVVLSVIVLASPRKKSAVVVEAWVKFKLTPLTVDPSVVAQVPVVLRIEPVVMPVPDIFAMVPVVAELAVKLNIPVPVYTPVLVMARSAPEVVVLAIETISLAVAGERVVEDLLQ